jgi:hypothetical protein
MAGVGQSYFDMTVLNCGTVAPGIVFTGSKKNNSGNNEFSYLAVSGGNEGLQFIKGPVNARAFTASHFGYVWIVQSVVPPKIYTAVDFNSVCDTNTFDNIQFYSPLAANGIIFNSASTITDSDANGIIIKMFAETGGFTEGTALTINLSSGNYVVTGVLAGSSQIRVANGGPGNSPSFTWIQTDPTPGALAQVSSQILEARSGKTSDLPALR